MAKPKTALSLLAHPDDAEFMCAGTLALLREKGWQVHTATMAPGDCGTAEYNREDISRIRRAEAAEAASILDGTYQDLDCGDGFILYDRETILKTLALLRKLRPTIVFTASPSDYMVDHEMTSRLVRSASFFCGLPNIPTEGIEPFEPVPHLYYVDAMEGKDILGQRLDPSILVNITSTIDTKEKMLCCHASQRNWLRQHHGIDEYVISMKRFAKERGRMINCEYAEGFRQHLGHGFPQDNILPAELGALAQEIQEI